MTLTDFKAEHIDGVLALEQECFVHPWSRADLAAQLANQHAHFLVALDAQTVVGYLGVQIICGEGYVTNVAVTDAYRKQGIANALFEKCFRDNQMDFLTLEVRAGNAPAIALYRKLGFKQVGVRKNFYSDPEEDALLMTRYF